MSIYLHWLLFAYVNLLTLKLQIIAILRENLVASQKVYSICNQSLLRL